MKIVLHIFGILFLFAAILIGPDIWDAIKGPEQWPPQITITPEQEKTILEATRKPGLPKMPPMPTPAEPEQPRGGGVIESAGGGDGSDTFVVGGRSINDNLVPGSFDGSSGNDTLAADGPGWASLDGVQIRSFEVFRFRNDQPNILYIQAGGLESTDNGKVTVDGDVALDSVWLDPVLDWKQVAEGDYVIYEGKDSGGRVYTVSIKTGVKIEIKQKP